MSKKGKTLADFALTGREVMEMDLRQHRRSSNRVRLVSAPIRSRHWRRIDEREKRAAVLTALDEPYKPKQFGAKTTTHRAALVKSLNDLKLLELVEKHLQMEKPFKGFPSVAIDLEPANTIIARFRAEHIKELALLIELAFPLPWNELDEYYGHERDG